MISLRKINPAAFLRSLRAKEEPEQKPEPKREAPKFKQSLPKFEYVEAFECEGVRTFQCKQISDLPAMRGLMAHPYYEETRMRYTFTELELETKLEDAILSKPTITAQDLLDLKMILRLRRERMAMPAELETVYRLASVVYVDEGESWLDYDHNYNVNTKIARWKRNPEVLAFFLGQSIMTLHGYLKHQEMPLRDFLKTHEELIGFQKVVLREINLKMSQEPLKKNESPSRAGSPSKSTTRPSVL